MEGALRTEVRIRARHRCEYCGLPQEAAPFPLFHVEHICPRKHGGTDAFENLCLACNHCNLHKSCNLTGRDPQTGEICRLFNPRMDSWMEHFRLDGPIILGRSNIGRTTVRVLNMNDADRIELRAAALKLGYMVSRT